MKRRNFFSKISKGILGLGIFKAFGNPTEASKSLPVAPPSDTVSKFTLPADITPRGFVCDADGNYYIAETPLSDEHLDSIDRDAHRTGLYSVKGGEITSLETELDTPYNTVRIVRYYDKLTGKQLKLKDVSYPLPSTIHREISYIGLD